MFRYLVPFTMLFSVLGTSAPIPKKGDAKDYTGLKFGAKWVYEGQKGKDTIEVVREVVEYSIGDDKTPKIVLSESLTIDKALHAKKNTYRIAGGFVEQTEVNGREIPVQCVCRRA